MVFNHEAVFGESKNKVLENTDIYSYSRTEGLPTAVIGDVLWSSVLVTEEQAFTTMSKISMRLAVETNAVSIADKLLLLTKQNQK